MNKNTTIVFALILIGIIGFTAWKINDINTKNQVGNPPNSAENAPAGSIHNLPIPTAVSAAKSTLATEVGITESEILILEALETEWSDSCLGLGGPAESCLQVITPGYNVLMQANGKEYRYRTNSDGSAIRAES
jgi:hypothetical protein